jgi:hypothetical protein
VEEQAMREEVEGYERKKWRPHATTYRHIYFIGAGDLVKVGLSDKPYERMAGLRTGSPLALEMLGFYPGTKHDERRLHHRLGAGHSHGEWFRLNTPGLQVEIDKAGSYMRQSGIEEPVSFPTATPKSPAQEDFMEAAGIEPASRYSGNGASSGGIIFPRIDVDFKPQWDSEGKLDGAGEGGGVVPHELEGNNRPPKFESPSPSNFSAKTTICGIDFEVHREGKHVNLHLYSDEENLERLWTFEPVETAIPKLEAILGAARLAANSS